MEHRQGLAASYQESRERFLDAARAAGASIHSWPHPMTGIDGEELAVDVAVLGPSDATAVLLVVSGTHGVEGFTGSALQHRWLTARAAELPAGVRVVLLHAFNPYGFSWVRRVNEDNVDLNRNFVDWEQPPPANEDYGGIAHLLVPDRWDDDTQQSTTLQLLAYAEEVGFARLQEVVSGGQYTHPTGIFHGGSGPVWSHRWLRAHLPELVGGATTLVIVDLHTGLGPWGHGELISHEGRDDPGYQRGCEWWGDVRSMRDGESVSANLTGDWLAAVGSMVPGVEVTAVALEYGTVDTISVLQALRADAVLHASGAERHDGADTVRAQVRAAFADDDPAWFDAVGARFDEVITATLTHMVPSGADTP
ncbi:MAG TPA: M14 family metallopeptidase [Ilumatobacteraceae bacterium]|nr:M14 family metallopeptidase [Ilumatobacteraceae bacterium]